MSSTSLYWQVTGDSRMLEGFIMTVPVTWTVAWRDYKLNVPDSVSISVDSMGKEQAYTITPQGEASHGTMIRYTLREPDRDSVHLLFDNGLPMPRCRWAETICSTVPPATPQRRSLWRLWTSRRGKTVPGRICW
ncbi:hypothetical protein O1E46_RS15640 [Enterobacter hormaechei]